MIFKYKALIIFTILITSPLLFGEPKLIIESPKDENMTVYSSKVVFKGQAKETSKLTINGQEIPINQAGNFEHTIQLNSKNGNNYFLIEASDGTTTTQENRTIYYNENEQEQGKKSCKKSHRKKQTQNHGKNYSIEKRTNTF